MSLKNKNRIFAVIALAIFITACLSVWFSRGTAPVPEILRNYKTVQIGGATIQAELAVTEAEQVQGLSGRTSLATSTGMLFVFANPSPDWGIWMKDMSFPIDVLWITDDFKVSDIVEGMTPESYPKVYMPHVPTRYVLEVPMGTVKQYGIVVGQDVLIK